MRVAMLAPPWFPVPPPAYGGTEAVVSLLTEGLVERGVDVTLFATGDSRTRANLECVYQDAPSEKIGDLSTEMDHVLACLGRAADFDLVHDHSGLLAVTLAASVETPFVHTAHGPFDGHLRDLYAKAMAFNPRAALISLTDAQRRPAPELPWIACCPNAIDVARFPLRDGHDGYLAFLGRMSPEKGAHNAIEVARASGCDLLIAAKCREPAERAYFDAFVRPNLGNGIEYVGELGHEDKASLLRDARALLSPIEWEEPFGLVLIEAAACGTPVIAFRRGSVPEVVADGVTGFVVDTLPQMAAALERVDDLSALAMREHVERCFSPSRMVRDYLRAYALVVGDAAAPVALSSRR